MEPLVNGPFWDTPATVLSVMAIELSASEVPPAFLSSEEQAEKRSEMLLRRNAKKVQNFILYSSFGRLANVCLL